MQGRLGREVGWVAPLVSPQRLQLVGEVVNRGSTGLQCIVWGGRSRESPESSPPPPIGAPKPVSSASLRAPRSMVAAFDYNPRESSPNMDVEVRTLRAQPRGVVVAGPPWA